MASPSVCFWPKAYVPRRTREKLRYGGRAMAEFMKIGGVLQGEIRMAYLGKGFYTFYT
jgi:hypothetical protein